MRWIPIDIFLKYFLWGNSKEFDKGIREGILIYKSYDFSFVSERITIINVSRKRIYK